MHASVSGGRTGGTFNFCASPVQFFPDRGVVFSGKSLQSAAALLVYVHLPSLLPPTAAAQPRVVVPGGDYRHKKPPIQQ